MMTIAGSAGCDVTLRERTSPLLSEEIQLQQQERARARARAARVGEAPPRSPSPVRGTTSAANAASNANANSADTTHANAAAAASADTTHANANAAADTTNAAANTSANAAADAAAAAAAEAAAAAAAAAANDDDRGTPAPGLAPDERPERGIVEPPPMEPANPTARALPSTERLAQVDANGLCVTRGELAGERRVVDPTFRAVAPHTAGDAASMRFVVSGRSDEVRALASGQERRQLGLKLRAQDGCNLVYVMWRLDPKPKLDVSVKRNIGKRTSEQCGARGYIKVKPRRSSNVPALLDGNEHELRAEIRNGHLFAWIDGDLVWEGRLPATAADISGPIGMRSDNLAFELRSLHGETASTASKVAVKCNDAASD